MMSPTTTTRLLFIRWISWSTPLPRERLRWLHRSTPVPADPQRRLNPTLEAIHAVSLLVLAIHDVMVAGGGRDIERAWRPPNPSAARKVRSTTPMKDLGVESRRRYQAGMDR